MHHQLPEPSDSDDPVVFWMRDFLLTPVIHDTHKIRRQAAPRMKVTPRRSLAGYVAPHDNGLIIRSNQCLVYTTHQAAYWLNCSTGRVRHIAQHKLAPVPSFTIKWAGRESYAFTNNDLLLMKEYLYGKDSTVTPDDR